MSGGEIVLLGDRGEASGPGRIELGSVLVDAEVLAVATGWVPEEAGLCRGPVCVPTPGDVIGPDGRVDVGLVARALGAPLAVAEGVAVLGEPAEHRTEVVETLDAPDFTLPDLDGHPFTFSSLGRKKKVLAVWASW